MEKREFEIGEVFDVGLIRLKCERAENLCKGCVFEKLHECGVMSEILGPCFPLGRADRNHVIFVKQN